MTDRLLKRSVCLFLGFSGCLRVIAVLVVMYRNLRIKNSNRSTPIPPTYKSYVFSCNLLDTVDYKVIIAPSRVVAYQRLRDFEYEQGLENLFWQFVCEDDFEVAYTNDVISK